MKKQIKPKKIIFLIGASFFYGLLLVIQKAGLNRGVSPLAFSFWRSLLLMPMTIVLLRKNFLKDFKKINKEDLLIFGLSCALAIFILFYGQKQTSAVNTGFLNRLTPVFVIPLTAVFLNKKIKPSKILAMFVMLFGAYLLSTKGKLIIPARGDVLIILATMFMGFQNVWAKKLMNKSPSYIIIFLRMVLGPLFLIISLPLIFGVKNLVFNQPLLLILSTILYFLSVYFHYNAIALVSPFIASSFFLSGSLFSAFFAFLILGETLISIQWIGATLILFGAYYLTAKR